MERVRVNLTFAPNVGVNWECKLGDSARYARAEGQGASAASFIVGARAWL